jgi:hypothetical protein
MNGRNHLTKPRRRWKDDTEKRVIETAYDSVEWIHQAQDGRYLHAFVNAITKSRVTLKEGIAF